MAIQGTDLLLINRGGESFYVKHEDILTKVDDDDLALVNSGGVSYKLPGSRLKDGTFGDNDLFLVNRGGESFKCLGSDVRIDVGPPIIKSAEWAYAGTPGNFKLTVEFRNKIDTTKPAFFRFDLTITGGNPSILVLDELSSVDRMQFWTNTTIAPTIDADSSLTQYQNDGQFASIALRIETLSFVNGGPTNSQAAFRNGTWRSVVEVVQDGEVTNASLAQGFTSSGDMFP